MRSAIIVAVVGVACNKAAPQADRSKPAVAAKPKRAWPSECPRDATAAIRRIAMGRLEAIALVPASYDSAKGTPLETDDTPADPMNASEYGESVYELAAVATCLSAVASRASVRIPAVDSALARVRKATQPGAALAELETLGDVSDLSALAQPLLTAVNRAFDRVAAAAGSSRCLRSRVAAAAGWLELHIDAAASAQGSAESADEATVRCENAPHGNPADCAEPPESRRDREQLRALARSAETLGRAWGQLEGAAPAHNAAIGPTGWAKKLATVTALDRAARDACKTARRPSPRPITPNNGGP